MLILLALGMAFLIIFITVVNPANKLIAELIPVIIICAVICMASIALAIFFVVPKKLKAKNNLTPEERRQSVIDYHLQKRCRTAEKLHSHLSDIVERHGLVRIRSGFLAYDLLYFIKPDKWFGFTFNDDVRDNYIEVQLGELYHFRDCIQRLVIVGEYIEIIKKLNVKNLLNSKIPLLDNAHRNIAKTIEIIKNTFEVVIDNIDSVADNSRKNDLAAHLTKKIKTIDDLKQLDLNAIIE